VSVVYEVEMAPRRRARRLPRGIALASLAFVLLLSWASPQPGAREDDSAQPGVLQPAEVGAGVRDAELDDGSKLSELGAPQLLAARLERGDGVIVLLFDLERPVAHWLERDAEREIVLVLDSARLAQPLGWLDFAGTPIRYLDVRRVGNALHLGIGLDAGARVEAQSAMLELSAGARLMLQLLERESDPDAPAAAPLVSKRPLERTGQDAYREALRLERAGEREQAFAVLRTLLASHPGHVQARARLVDGLAAAGRPAEALRVLRAGRARKTDPARARLEARLLVEQRADVEAIAVLERALSAAGDDPEYKAFLAALLQRSGAHERALALFAAAVTEEPGRADWWLGRAISEDAQGQGAAALLSLKRALRLGGLEPEPRRWAEQRASALAAEVVEAKP
jgi:tetratricopeptide (TPR) repeat protein